jgi:DNA-binding CsgD family transcriptional regulator
MLTGPLRGRGEPVAVALSVLWSTAEQRRKTGWARLTEAERRVTMLIGSGHTDRSAATELGVSVNTVGTHLRSVFAKLDIRSRVQLADILHKQTAG